MGQKKRLEERKPMLIELLLYIGHQTGHGDTGNPIRMVTVLWMKRKKKKRLSEVPQVT